WLCPTDPILRPECNSATICNVVGPQICEYDFQCAQDSSVPLKCCYDSALATRVCKPAILRN
ncbi:hypothetical protein ILUMI_08683, partial [Ignelater luminosus]